MCNSVVTLFPQNSWSNGVDTALPNPPGNLHRISLISLRLSLLSKNAGGYIQPVERVNVRVCWCDVSFNHIWDEAWKISFGWLYRGSLSKNFFRPLYNSSSEYKMEKKVDTHLHYHAHLISTK